MRIRSMLKLFALLCVGLPLVAQTVGEPLPPWRAGYIDIHQINTGKGDSALLIFPDGTSLLVDAGQGGAPGGPPRGTVPKPDGSRPAGEWIARYARRVLPGGEKAEVDYGYATHFHGDHIGDLDGEPPQSAKGPYRRTGFSEVAEHIAIRKMLDRGWPDYDFPVPLADPVAANYVAFVKARSGAGEMSVERLQPGRNDQIVLLRDRAKYSNFEVRNIAANGEVWTGVGTETRRQIPEKFRELPREDWPSENQCSMAIRISYGAFDYYTGGDMPGRADPGAPIWHDIETPVAKAVGPVEVAVLNHHGNRDSTNAFFVQSLRPRLWIIPVWSSDHPGHDVLDRMYSKRLYPDERDVLATNMLDANKAVIGPLLDRLVSDQGHILIRVEPGGGAYRAIVLEDGDESMRVKAVFGPYRAR